MTKNKPKFRVGQVVRHRVAGGFYGKIVKVQKHHDCEPAYAWMTNGKIEGQLYWQSQLRPLTKREAGR